MSIPLLRLRPFERGDFDIMKRWAVSPEFLMQWTGRTFAWPLDDDQLDAYLRETAGESPQRYAFMAVDGEGRILGHVGLRDINLIDGGAMVSCVLVDGAAGRGRGLGAALMERLCEFAFGDLRLHRLELHVFDFNRPAIACYERVGFRIEGLIRDKRKLGDDYWSPYLMSLLAPERKSRRSALA
jgi:RimJ/RimL family protein N-acetyltransferase